MVKISVLILLTLAYFIEFNQAAPSHKRTKRGASCTGGCPPVTFEDVLIGTPIIIGGVCFCFCLDFIAKRLFGYDGGIRYGDRGGCMCLAFIICCPLIPFWCLYNYFFGKKEEHQDEEAEVKSEPIPEDQNNVKDNSNTGYIYK